MPIRQAGSRKTKGIRAVFKRWDSNLMPDNDLDARTRIIAKEEIQAAGSGRNGNNVSGKNYFTTAEISLRNRYHKGHEGARRKTVKTKAFEILVIHKCPVEV